MITLSKEAFEKYVPAFRDAETRIFEAVLPYMQQYLDKARNVIKIPEDYAGDALVEAYVYRQAAWQALPHLDLVLTDNGFAVVSNNNLAPASRDRVAALQERLREEKADARDLLLMDLCRNTAWRDTEACRRLRSSLLWCPMLLRRYGVTAADGRQVFEREYNALLPQVLAAGEEAARIVSREQMQWLLEHQDECDEDGEPDLRSVVREMCRRFMAAVIADRKPAVRTLAAQIQDFLNRHADDLPEYAASSKFQADNFKPYENKKSAPAFLFNA